VARKKGTRRDQSDAPGPLSLTASHPDERSNIPLKLDQRYDAPPVQSTKIIIDADATAAMTPLPAAAVALRKLNNHAEGTNRKHFVLHSQRQHAVGHRCSSRALRPRQQTKDSPPPRPGHQYPPCFPPLGASSSHQFPPSTVISLYPEPRYYSRNTMSGKTSL
jgi:hypothetical protein